MSHCFLEMVEDHNWFQHVENSTRFRGAQNSCLDLILTNEENMVNNVQDLPPLGKSDHVCQKWKLIVSEPIFKNTTKPSLQIGMQLKQNYANLNSLQLTHQMQ